MHSPPPSSIHLHSAYFRLHPAPCNSLNVIRTKILHVIGQFPQIYTKKIQSYLSRLKIGTHGNLQALIPNLDLDFQNSDPKIHFWPSWGQKSQFCPLAWTLAHIISWKCWFQIWSKNFEIPTPNLGKFGPKNHSLFILIWDLFVFGCTVSFGFIF